MTTFAYFIQAGQKDTVQLQAELQQYMDSKGLVADQIIEDTQSVKVPWQKRAVGQLFEERLKAGDNLIVYEAAELARSTSQMLEILLEATLLQINIHFVKYEECFEGKATYELKDILCIMQHIECDYIARRTTDAVARRRAAGLPLGRPKGRKNKSLKLDRNRKEIMKYLGLGISKASIAKLIGCHPQTLYDWLERNGIHVAHSKRGRGAITDAILKDLPESELEEIKYLQEEES